MPYFRVLMHGQSISFALENEEPAIGFYATRTVRAQCAEEASRKAKDAVVGLWATAEYSARNNGGTPVISIDSVERIGFFQMLRTPDKGHVFYTRE